MIYCSNCGKELPVDSKFCPSCGVTINQSADAINKSTRADHGFNEPVKTQRVVTPVADLKKDIVTRKTINEFYKDAGFWGGLILIAGFFLPFFSKDSGSLFNAVQAEAAADKIVLLWLIFPIAGLFMLLHSLNVFPGFLAIFFTFFALIALIYWSYIMLNDRTKYFGSDEMFAIIKSLGLGVWATLLGTILLLFHRRHTKVEVHHTKYVDRTV